MTSTRTAFAGVLLTALLACGPAADEASDAASARPISLTDPTGRVVTLDRPVRRVVSMMPAVTEWLIAMGAAERLVARTDYDDHPAVASLPSVGGGLTPSIEWLASLEPDLVIAWPDAPSRSVVSRLEQVGIPAYAAPVESIEQALAVATDLGRILGREESAADAIAEVRHGLDSVRTTVAGYDRRDVLYLIGLDPLMAAGPGTFVHELLTVAGGRNVLDDLNILWPHLSLEEVVRREPDVVIVGSVRAGDPAELLSSRPGWRDVAAIRSGEVHAVDPDLANRPGPGLDEAAAVFAELIHSGALASPAPNR